jgi:hypothetical protein
MTNINPPVNLHSIAKHTHEVKQKFADSIVDKVNGIYQITICVHVCDNVLWVRLSAQVYLDLKHSETAANAVREICEKFSDDLDSIQKQDDYLNDRRLNWLEGRSSKIRLALREREIGR